MRLVVFSLILMLSLGAKAQAGEGLADVSGKWTGYFYQKNYFDPSAPDLAYRAVMVINQHDGSVTGQCYIYWFDNEHFYGNWRLDGNYDGLKFEYTESELTEDFCKPGYAWCLKDVSSYVTYNAELGKWILNGKFSGRTGFSDCNPGTLVLMKEGDI